MTRIFPIVQLFFLGLTQAIFLWITTPSPAIQPTLYGVFCLATSASFLVSHVPLNRATWPYPILVVRFIPFAIFGFVWSLGIVATTQFISQQIAIKSGVDAILFYSTSGTQFLSYQDTVFLGILWMPIALLYLIISSWLQRN